ncbi:hypothetical protein FSARC_2694 [Fusarium sarcochroum]|uniref:Uncharacterized protein n=1 Tax=Fusarium sarcochroum TaxID=1208366 RepID=A0A8H4U616_9HYPO|nr:hypothetical protein FSARC_2694 [Fusarium sarcochroum]
MKIASVLLTLGLVYIQSVVAYYEVLGEAGIPSNISTEEWDSYFNKSPDNATGSYIFDGYNISGPYSPTDTVDGWEATIKVANITRNDGSSYPGTSIGIKAPRELPVLTSSQSEKSDWHVCIDFWAPTTLKYGIDDRWSDNGSCSSFFSDECVQAMKRSVDSFLYWKDPLGRCGSVAIMPPQCDENYGDKGIENRTAFKANLTTFDGRTLISGRPDNSTPRGAASSKDESYEDAVRGIWAVMINWGRYNPDGSMLSESDVAGPTLLCLRAGNVNEDEDSENPNAVARLRHVPPARGKNLLEKLAKLIRGTLSIDQLGLDDLFTFLRQQVSQHVMPKGNANRVFELKDCVAAQKWLE